MSSDATIHQSGEDRRKAQELSLRRTRPPTQVAGYEAVRFLGEGAFGEVWVAIDANTGRKVAIKFYAHRGGLDWSLLSREVEKLRFLFSDRYVVQLLDVGWESDPPYYVMEYLERGSLADRIEADGPLPVDQALALFREIAVGLLHAHAKGVLHCDLKPANVLLDEDLKPRLADFGQARLSHEQSPALGTLFYMAPEQADLSAVPEARWDVYALGALFYCMLTGEPPYRDDESVTEIESAQGLDGRLSTYRRLLERAPTPTAHRKAPGVDRMLADIIDRCLAIRVKQRFPNPQAVLDALREREARLARRPLLVLGALGPALLLLIASIFAWRGFEGAVQDSRAAVVQRALDANRFAVRSVAENVGYNIAGRFDALTHLAEDPQLLARMAAAARDPRLKELSLALKDLNLPPEQRTHSEEELANLQREFLTLPVHQELERRLEELSESGRVQNAYSWFVNDASGTQLARVQSKAELGDFHAQTVGRNYAWRAYFHGGQSDLDNTNIDHGRHITAPFLGPPFRSQNTREWLVGVSVPIVDDEEFVGILAFTMRVGEFATFEDSEDQFWALVDARPGPLQGLIMQHPLFGELAETRRTMLARFEPRRTPIRYLPDQSEPTAVYVDYRDPLGDDKEGEKYRGEWLAAFSRVRVNGQDMGLVAIVQERQDSVVEPVRELSRRLLRNGLLGIGVLGIVIAGLWGFVAVGLSPHSRWRFSRRRQAAGSPSTQSGSNDTAPRAAPPAPTDVQTPPESNLFS